MHRVFEANETNSSVHNYGMSVRTTIDIPDDLHAELRRRSGGTSFDSFLNHQRH
jgi:hypothetical protein